MCGSSQQLLPDQQLLQEVFLLQGLERLVQQVLQDLVRFDLCQHLQQHLCGSSSQLCRSGSAVLCRSLCDRHVDLPVADRLLCSSASCCHPQAGQSL
jgi:hypothetical protein